MANNALGKIVSLIQKTGDKCIILDHTGEPAYVVMPFDDYEKFLTAKPQVSGLTEDELLENINQDISAWRSGQNVEPEANLLSNQDPFEVGKKQSNKTSQQESVVIEPLGEVEADKNMLNEAKNKPDGDQYYFDPID